MSSDHRDETPTAGPGAPLANPGRRRFARAGIGASAVLGVLHAKPVLAGDSSIYHCTTSGQVSGNMSRPEGVVDCSQLGRSPEDWLNDLGSDGLAEIFNVAMGGDSYFFLNMNPQENEEAKAGESSAGGSGKVNNKDKDKGSNKKTTGLDDQQSGEQLKVQMETSEWPATMGHVLGPTNDGSSPDLVLGKVAAATLLSARAEAIASHRFPLTPTAVQNMFASVYGNGKGYVAAAGSNVVIWDRDRVIRYMASLFMEA